MTANGINYRGTAFSTANFVRLVRRELDRRSVYATVDGKYRGRLYRINLAGEELQLDFSNAIVPVGCNAVVELSDGINEIAF
jgi:hypothetical protein